MAITMSNPGPLVGIAGTILGTSYLNCIIRTVLGNAMYFKVFVAGLAYY